MDFSRVLMLGSVDKWELNEGLVRVERVLGLVRGLLGLIGVLGLFGVLVLILLCLVLRLNGIIYKIVLDFFMIFINFIPLIGILGFRFGREYMDIIDFRIVWS